jgi:hypothetical protein
MIVSPPWRIAPPVRHGWSHSLLRRAAPAVALVFFATLAATIVSAPDSVPPPALESSAAATSRSLEVSITAVLAAAQRAENAGPDDAPAAALEGAWNVLALVTEREQAQIDVAAGRRPPLMKAPPLAPGRPARDDAFNQAALSYLRAALPVRDLRALERAVELLELGRR